MPKFVLRKSWTFEAPVIVREPGTGLAFDFVGVFELQPIDADGNVNWLDAFKGWRGIADETAPNGELAVTPENRAALIHWPHVRLAIMNAYLGETNRLAEKNSAPPAAPGPATTVN